MKKYLSSIESRFLLAFLLLLLVDLLDTTIKSGDVTDLLGRTLIRFSTLVAAYILVKIKMK